MRRNQRGIFGLSIALSLLVYLGFAAAALIAIHGFDISRQHIGRDEQRRADAPVMSICDTLATTPGLFGPKKATTDECAAQLRTGLTAIGANLTLQKDVDTLRRERDECSARVRRIEQTGNRMKAAAEQRKPADDKAITEIDLDAADMRATLGLPDKGGTCEQELARRNAIAERVKRQRLRDFAPSGVPASDDVTIKTPK